MSSVAYNRHIIKRDMSLKCTTHYASLLKFMKTTDKDTFLKEWERDRMKDK